ncbi:hypothetical protein [Halarsenatibacter silvermanii]|uniref:Uncharacterized protein n=1 Tax=Halarsenatibacter silvermanii TaxID=321763 RepID=A0A1G9RV44_9FIRM|nr:hypothetical protein [Halarsenatibacter silvermanii]SDM26900.1 hypothetical protein SAMN04488692_12412 [Halarsenatibacter silvermanii]
MISKLALIIIALKLILAGIDNRKAVRRVARDYDVDFSELWKLIPDKFK